MNLTTLKAEEKRLRKEIQEAELKATTHPEVIKAQVAYLAALKKMKVEFIGTKLEDLAKTMAQARKIEQEKKAEKLSVVPPKILAAIQVFYHGVNWSGTLKAVWWSESQRHFIMTIPGCTEWSGRGSTCYHQSKSVLLDMNMQNHNIGYDAYRNMLVGGENDGRLTKEVKAKLIQLAADREAKK